jgi:hypothetical protein
MEKSQAGLVDAVSIDLVKNFDQAGPTGSVANAAGLLTTINSLDIIVWARPKKMGSGNVPSSLNNDLGGYFLRRL